MNKIERTALAYLLKTGKTNLIYRSHDSPDFYNDKEGFEIKRLFQGGIYMHLSQLQKMKDATYPITILAFKDGHEEPTATISLSQINYEGNDEKIQDVSIHILPDMPSVKIDPNVRKNLFMIAGEIRSKTGTNTTLSDAVNFLIKFYREHKEA
jgi:hypothetical protein